MRKVALLQVQLRFKRFNMDVAMLMVPMSA